MAFTRDDLAAYEQQPQTATPDPIVTAPAATEPEPVQAEPAATEESSAPAETDQPEAGDATSDADDAGSSTAAADAEGGLEEGETEGDGAAEGEQESTAQPAKPQSRAFKRIQELNSKMLEASDLAEGYKEFGKLTLEQLKAAQVEIERLKGGGKPAPESTAQASEAVSDKLGPMPKLTDPEINFDPDILAEKTAEWTRKAIKLGVQETLQQATQETAQKTEAQKAVATFQSRIEDFKKTHSDWDTKVKNPALPRLHPAAQAVVVKSELGAAITYHLATNVEEAKRIAALPPEDQAAEIGAIRVQLAKDAKANPAPAGAASGSKGVPVTAAKVVKKSVSQAPPPPTPVPAGQRSRERDATDPSMGMDEFARQHRASKQNARLAARKLRGLS
jgi:hypothetical protein